MDSARFDGLVRSFGQTRSRRQTLRGLAGIAVGALALGGREARAQACKADGKACKKNGQCCSGNCAAGTGGGSTAGSAGVCEPAAPVCLTFLAPCADRPEPCCAGTICADNLCAGIGGNCLLPNGVACTNACDCANGGCESGHCCSSVFGFCGSSADCCSGLTCLLVSTGDGVCTGP
jgi:hypothetical protein